MIDAVYFLGGLALLVAGAEMLVRGGASLAARVGVSSLVIGLTIVAYGTSSPEIVVSAKSALSGRPDIAIGNVVGSNIFNVLFILGAASLISPLNVSQQLVRFDVPVMIGVSILAYVLSMDGLLGKADGLIFIACLIAYTVLVIYWGRKEKNAAVIGEYENEYGSKKKSRSWLVDAALIAAGLTALVLGARWFVEGAVAFARGFGLSELVIGLTIVAAGTSMPEVATSIMASLRKEKDIAAGNVVGSNIYNILCILGVSSLLAPKEGLAISAGMREFDMPFMIVVAASCLPIFFTGGGISRAEGAIFLFYYVAYTVFLIKSSAGHDQLPAASPEALSFILPLVLMTAVVVWFQRRSKKRGV